MSLDTLIKTSKRKGLADSAFGTRNLMIIAALAVVGSMIVVPLTYVGIAWAVTPGGILATCAFMGLWLVPYLLPAAIVRRPGAAMVAAVIIGIIAVFTTPQGPLAVVGSLIGGALVEIPLAVLLYRAWTWWSYTICALAFALFNGMLYAVTQNVQVTSGMQLAIVLCSVASSLIGVAACLGLRRVLIRAGVAAR